MYFPKDPLEIQYKNEIFNKIRQYSGYEISRYLSFHFHAFKSKKEFLEFLKYETDERFQLNISKKFKFKFLLAQEWIEERRNVVELPEESNIKRGQNTEQPEIDSGDYNQRLESIIANVDVKFEELSKTHNPRNIQLVNSANYTKLIQLLIVLRDLQTTYKKGTSAISYLKVFPPQI